MKRPSFPMAFIVVILCTVIFSVACSSGSSGENNDTQTQTDTNTGTDTDTGADTETDTGTDTDTGTSGDGEQTAVTDDEELVQPEDITYSGAFRLPGEEGRDGSFSYGGYAMTYSPRNSGSLFIMGHNRLPYDEFPNGNQVAEVSIPAPVNSKTVSSLNTASFIQDFINIRGSYFDAYAELPQVGMEYLNIAETGEKIHLAWGHHFHEDASEQGPTHAWFSPDLSTSDIQGAWYIGTRSLYSTNAYIFEIYQSWADTYVGGRYLATGRYRDGGWSGQGPVIFAYAPWLSGNPPADGTRLDEIPLLLYSSSIDDPDTTRSMNNYQHADQWEGGAFLSTSTGKMSVIFAGTKGTGEKYWYGWVNPEGESYPCIETELRDQFTTCRYADKSACPESDLNGCTGHNDNRGWWSSRFDAQIIFYDPANLAGVASGTMQSYEPQPYASLDIDDYLILQEGVEDDMLGTGNQRISRVGSVAFDRTNQRLFILEPFADGTKPVVHVFTIN